MTTAVPRRAFLASLLCLPALTAVVRPLPQTPLWKANLPTGIPALQQEFINSFFFNFHTQETISLLPPADPVGHVPSDVARSANAASPRFTETGAGTGSDFHSPSGQGDPIRSPYRGGSHATDRGRVSTTRPNMHNGSLINRTG